jgi:hypothetical protein
MAKEAEDVGINFMVVSVTSHLLYVSERLNIKNSLITAKVKLDAVREKLDRKEKGAEEELVAQLKTLSGNLQGVTREIDRQKKNLEAKMLREKNEEAAEKLALAGKGE